MADASVFRGGLEFLEQIGVYDVVLPFLLSFTLVFAMLEKTKILGTQKDTSSDSDDKTIYPKRNLNSMVAFVIAFFVVASSKLVALINETVSYIFMLVLFAVMFMMVAGSFGKDEEFFLKDKQKTFFMWTMFVAILLIFLNALGWLEWIYNFVKDYWNTEAVSALIFLALIGLFIFIIGNPLKKTQPKKDD